MDLLKYDYLVGADEVGRGCLAGPLVASAVAVKPSLLNLLEGIVDSKLLDHRQRKERLKKVFHLIDYFSIVSVSSREIDKKGISECNEKAILMAIERVISKTEGKKVLVIVDHIKISFSRGDVQIISVPKADQNFKPVSLASILAKVSRDLTLACLEEEFSSFSFSEHKGYGTKKHLKEIQEFSPTPIHRKSYKPVLNVRLF